MQSMMSRMRRMGAFTLVELMIVVVIVAILALVAVPLYSGHLLAAKMSEGIAGVGTIRTALRVYSAGNNGNYPTVTADGTGLAAYGIAAADLNDGKYFKAANYSVVSTDTTYTVTATLGSDTYAVDQDGLEKGTYKTGQ